MALRKIQQNHPQNSKPPANYVQNIGNDRQNHRLKPMANENKTIRNQPTANENKIIQNQPTANENKIIRNQPMAKQFEMNARQLIQGADRKKRPRPIVEYSSSESDPGIDNQVEIPQQDDDKVRFVVQKTTKGKIDLWHDGFRFLLNRKHKGKAYWRCEEFRPPKRCGVSAITDSENYEEGTINGKAHKHLAKTHGQEIERRLNNYTERLQNDLEIPTAALIDEVKETEDDEMFTQLPTYAALHSKGARKRRRFGHKLNAPNAASIVIPDEFQFKNGKPFLIYDSDETRPQAADRVLVFGSAKAIEFLRVNKNWAADATFQTCPRQFSQQFVLGFILEHKVFPAVYALMTNKSKVQYVEVLNGIKKVLGNDMPISVMTDFEKSEYSAFVDVFPQINNKACLFHLAQSFIRRIKKLGFIGQYKNLEPFRRTVRWCQALAFLPPEMVRRGFALTIEQSPPELNEFLYYVGKNYIGLSEWEERSKALAFLPRADEDRMMAGLVGHSTPIAPLIDSAIVRSLLTPDSQIERSRRPNITEDFSNTAIGNITPMAPRFNESQIAPRYELPLAKPPKFALDFWNVRDRIQEDLPRCQASAEANNLAFQKRNCTHPRMHEFLINLRKYDSRKMNEVRELKLQPEQNYRRVLYRTMDARLKALIQAPLLNDQCIRTFMEAVSLALQGLENDLILSDAEAEGQNNGDGEENNEEVMDENYGQDDELFFEEDDENTGATTQFIDDIKAPINRSSTSTINMASTSNISTDYSAHDYY